jgi:membrane fusion protein (multidrug efflux system)
VSALSSSLEPVELSDALVIFQTATFDIVDKKFVYVTEELISSREISVAEELPHLYVVAPGITEAHTIFVEGLRKVHDGMSSSRDITPSSPASL